jgi:hypothetical protein
MIQIMNKVIITYVNIDVSHALVINLNQNAIHFYPNMRNKFTIDYNLLFNSYTCIKLIIEANQKQTVQKT